jgi:hypothetical protein
VADYSGSGTVTPRSRMPWGNSKPRPTSMVAFSPPHSPSRSQPRSPPKVTVQSPKSPPPNSYDTPILSPRPSRPSSHAALASSSTSAPAPASTKPFKIAARTVTPNQDSKPLFPPSPGAGPPADLRKGERPTASAPPVPPPVNRAGKPKIPSKSHSADIAGRDSLAPEASTDNTEDRSPFSTPPSSSGSTKAPNVSPPIIPNLSKPKIPANKESYFPPPPIHHSVAEKLPPTDSRVAGNQVSQRSALPPLNGHHSGDPSDDRPSLPVRREKDNFDMRKSVQLQRALPPDLPARRSIDTSRPLSLANEYNDKFMIPPRRTQTVNGTSPKKSLEPPKPPPPRNSGEMRRPTPPPPSRASQQYAYDSDDVDAMPDKQPTAALTDFPDSSQANRRPPMFPGDNTGIPTGYDTKLFAVCGDYICTTGYVTSVWNVLNGRLLVSLSHGDTVKATALAFRPAKDVEDEGKRLWLGMNTGEMHEVDIPTQSVVHTKTSAHSRTPIVKIFRYASEMWSLDDEGKLNIWPSDESGSPSLQQTPYTFRIPRGHTFSIVSGSQLWVAYTKELRVFKRTGDHNYFQQLTDGTLSQLNVGDVTSGAVVSSQPDRIYFGHIDGKVTIYTKKKFECLGIVNVSLYKISSLVGVGDFLWAGYSTGMIYVYDTTCTPWKVLKDWKAHEKPIAGIIADRTSIWKLDRFQVASLGTDMMLRVWDGMLKTDWLGKSELHHVGAVTDSFQKL